MVDMIYQALSVPAGTAQRLVDAEQALHDLRIGQAAVVIKVEGREVHYRASTVEQLASYVEQLRGELNPCPQRRRGGAIGIRFI